MRTHYDNLHISEKASPEVIRAAYKALAQKWHPDKNGHQREKADQYFKIISKAFEVLSDPAARIEYDALIKRQRAERERGQPTDDTLHAQYDRQQQKVDKSAVGRKGKIKAFICCALASIVCVWAIGRYDLDTKIKNANGQIIAERPASKTTDQWLAEVRKAEALIASGELPVVAGNYVQSIPENSGLWPRDASDLIESQSLWWWYKTDGFRLRVSNTSIYSIKTILFSFESKECSESNNSQWFYVGLEHSIEPSQSVVISFPGGGQALSSGVGNCLVISDIWDQQSSMTGQ